MSQKGEWGGVYIVVEINIQTRKIINQTRERKESSHAIKSVRKREKSQTLILRKV